MRAAHGTRPCRTGDGRSTGGLRTARIEPSHGGICRLRSLRVDALQPASFPAIKPAIAMSPLRCDCCTHGAPGWTEIPRAAPAFPRAFLILCPAPFVEGGTCRFPRERTRDTTTTHACLPDRTFDASGGMGGADRSGRLRNEIAGSARWSATAAVEVTSSRDVPSCRCRSREFSVGGRRVGRPSVVVGRVRRRGPGVARESVTSHGSREPMRGSRCEGAKWHGAA